MASKSEDVYREFINDPETSWLFALVSFAIIEEQRIEWMDHFTEHNGQAPTSEEIQNWYEQQPPNVLLRAKGTAENALLLYSDEVLDEVLETERRDVAESVIVSEIRLANKFWPSFGIHVAAGVFSAFIFALLLAILAFIILSDSSLSKLVGMAPAPQIEEAADGKEMGKK